MDTTYIMKVEELARKLDSGIFTQVDVNYKVCVSIDGLSICDGSFETSVCCRGLTYEDACKNYIERLNSLKKGDYLWHSGKKAMVIM